MSGWKVSARTLAVGLLAIAVPLALYYGVPALEDAGHYNYSIGLSDYGEAAWIGLVAAFVIYCSYRFGWREQVGQNWLFIGLAAVMFAVGDLVYGLYEVPFGASGMPPLTGPDGGPPYPGPPDAFYMAAYVFFLIAVVRAALAYRGLVRVKWPMIASGIVAVVLLVVAWFAALRPVLVMPDLPNAERAISIAYPVADILLELMPAIFIVLVVLQLGRGKLAVPWIVLAIGVAVLAAADAGYSVLEAHELYESGAITDLGWALGYGITALAASLAGDVFSVG